MGKVERSVQPFVATISPILGEKRWVTVEEFVEITNQRSNTRQNVFCNFSMRTGYNMQLIIHLVSQHNHSFTEFKYLYSTLIKKFK